MPARRRIRAMLLCAALAACQDSLHPPDFTLTFTVLNHEVWLGGAVSVVSPYFGIGDSVGVLWDDSSIGPLASPGMGDTLRFWVASRAPGTHSLRLRIRGVTSEPQSVDVHGLESYQAIPGLVTQPLVQVSGGTKLWIGTSAGIGEMDVRYPPAIMVPLDTTVDASCLDQIGRAEAGGIIVADKGCTMIRARAYRPEAVDLDSGPPLGWWRFAAHHTSGIWLMGSQNAVALAMRTDTSWTWTQFGMRAYGFISSPDGRIAAAVDPSDRGILVVDLANGHVVMRDSLLGEIPAAVFSPSGDTLLILADSTARLVDSHTGARLSTHVIHRPWPEWWPASVSGHSAAVWDPYRPWIFALGRGNYGCPQITVIDRRTWTIESMWANGDCGAYHYLMLFNAFEDRAWLMEDDAWLVTVRLASGQ